MIWSTSPRLTSSISVSQSACSARSSAGEGDQSRGRPIRRRARGTPRSASTGTHRTRASFRRTRDVDQVMSAPPDSDKLQTKVDSRGRPVAPKGSVLSSTPRVVKSGAARLLASAPRCHSTRVPTRPFVWRGCLGMSTPAPRASSPTVKPDRCRALVMSAAMLTGGSGRPVIAARTPSCRTGARCGSSSRR